MAITLEGPRTKASDVAELAAQSDGKHLPFPEPVLRIFHEHETELQELRADTKISDSFRQEQEQALEDKTDRRMRQWRESATAEALKENDKKQGEVLARIKGTVTSTSSQYETDSERAERHFRRTQATTETLTDALLAQSLSDPVELQDLFDATVERGDIDRARKVLPMVLARLEMLTKSGSKDAEPINKAARSAFMEFKHKNPPDIAQLRAVRAEREGIEQPIARIDTRAREFFKFGRHRHSVTVF